MNANGGISSGTRWTTRSYPFSRARERAVEARKLASASNVAQSGDNLLAGATGNSCRCFLPRDGDPLTFFSESLPDRAGFRPGAKRATDFFHVKVRHNRELSYVRFDD